MATSLLEYLAPVSERATQDLAELGRRIRSTGYRNAFLCVLAIFVAAWLKSFGAVGYFGLWGMIIAVEIFVAFGVLPYLLGSTPPVWAAAFMTGTAGEQNRLPEGLENAGQWTKRIWRFGLWIVVYSSLALWVVALWDIEDNFHLILPLIAAGIGVTVLVVLLFKEGNFFGWLVYGFKLLVLLGLLGMALPGEWGMTATRWVDAARSLTNAHKAEDGALRAAQAAIAKQRAACFNTLTNKADGGTIPTKAEFVKCEAIGKEKVDGDTTVVKTPTASTSAVSAPVASSALVQGQTAGECSEVVKSVDFIPIWDASTNSGRVDIGEVPPGRYEVRFGGSHQQYFYDSAVVQDGELTMSLACTMDAEGVMGQCLDPQKQSVDNRRGTRWEAPSHSPEGVPLLIPGEKYGKAVLWAWEKPLAIGQRAWLDVQDDPINLAVDLNRYQGAINYGGGKKSLHVTVLRCSA